MPQLDGNIWDDGRFRIPVDGAFGENENAVCSGHEKPGEQKTPQEFPALANSVGLCQLCGCQHASQWPANAYRSNC